MELGSNLLIEVFSFVTQEVLENIRRRRAEGIALRQAKKKWGDLTFPQNLRAVESEKAQVKGGLVLTQNF